MGRPGSRLLLTVCACMLLAACVPGGPQGPSPGSVALRRGDVPAGWTRCGWSGDIGRYITSQHKVAPASAEDLQSSWNALRRLGAMEANATGYAQQAADCQATLGHGRSASAFSWVIQYRDDSAAHAGYEHGVLGLPTPTSEWDQPAGLLVGIPTGLGTSDAWTLTQASPAPPLYEAWWRDGTLTAYLLVVGIPESLAQPIALRMDRRMG
jgi:hypothetical protein